MSKKSRRRWCGQRVERAADLYERSFAVEVRLVASMDGF